MLALKNGKLTIDNITLALDNLRLVYMFFPTSFKWRFLNPSEWLYSYEDIDALPEDAILDLHEELSSFPRSVQSEFRYLLKDFNGIHAKVNMKNLSIHNIDLLPALLKHRRARQERLAQWLASEPSIDFISPNKRLSVTMSKQGVLWHKNQAMLPWQCYDKLVSTEKYGLGWKRPFMIIYWSRTDRGEKRGFIGTEIANDDIEHFLAEHHFWMRTGLGPEGLEDLRLYRMRLRELKTRNFGKFILIMALIGVAVGTVLCFVSYVLPVR
ncbi:MAG: hypothetical protein JXB07_08245 [Anaerolineae bacterium]|nr:hypothetical protein [Anaerolineae bacterium]